MALAHVSQPFPALPPHVPDEIAAFVAQLTSKDPGLRPPDAAAVADQAARLRDGLIAVGRDRCPGSSDGCVAARGGCAAPRRSSPIPSRWPRLRGGQVPARRREVSAWGRLVLAGAVAACLLAGLVLVSVFATGSAPSAASVRHRSGSGQGSNQLSPSSTATVTSAVAHGRRPAGSLVTVVGAREAPAGDRVRAPVQERCKGNGQPERPRLTERATTRARGRGTARAAPWAARCPAGGPVSSGDGNSQGDG